MKSRTLMHALAFVRQVWFQLGEMGFFSNRVFPTADLGMPGGWLYQYPVHEVLLRNTQKSLCICSALGQFENHGRHVSPACLQWPRAHKCCAKQFPFVQPTPPRFLLD